MRCLPTKETASVNMTINAICARSNMATNGQDVFPLPANSQHRSSRALFASRQTRRTYWMLCSNCLVRESSKVSLAKACDSPGFRLDGSLVHSESWSWTRRAAWLPDTGREASCTATAAQFLRYWTAQFRPLYGHHRVAGCSEQFQSLNPVVRTRRSPARKDGSGASSA